MKSKTLLTIALLILTTGCVQKRSHSESKSSGTKREIVQGENQSSRQVKENSDQASVIKEGKPSSGNDVPNLATDLAYNGFYYSLQGKYGEVIVVNKRHPLSPDYAPGENPQAQTAFFELVAAMQAQGYDVTQNYSGYRSYAAQAELYQSYVNRDGQYQADRYSARAGYSEHQTGLAFDLIDSSGALLNEAGATSWLANHAHDYGFIVRYLPGKEAITGYMPEEWHVRYIGPEAREIYQSGLTLEEYYGFEGGNYLK